MIKAGIQRFLNRRGYEIYRLATQFTAAELEAMERVAPYTATSKSRMVGLIDAVKYIVANRIEGAFVECGVWRGGRSMLAASTLKPNPRNTSSRASENSPTDTHSRFKSF